MVGSYPGFCLLSIIFFFSSILNLSAQAPVITSFSPSTANFGETVTITGSNFTGTYYVSFGGETAQSFFVESDNVIRAVVGAGKSGDVSVFRTGGFTSKSGFVFTGPLISSFTPTSAKKGTTVTITGSNFTNASYVTFGGVSATGLTVVSPTQITAVVGEGKSGQIIVGTPNGTATINNFNYTGPLISYFSPTTSGAGKTVAIIGDNFTGATSVKFGGVAASSFTVVNFTYISAVVGSGASGNVEVTTPNGSVTLSGFTYTGPPVVTSFTPASASANTTVTIKGTNFTGATAVKFGGINAQSKAVLNSTTISAIPGPSALSGAVSVTTPYGEGSKPGFTFLPAPTITNYSHGQGGNGTIVTLTGTNFVNVSRVTFGGVAASFVVNSPTSIQATVGAGASGDIQVQTPGGTASVPGFIYIQAPTLTSFTPTSAATGISVSIFGTNLSTVTAVSFGGVPALRFAYNSNTQITAYVAGGTSGVISITTLGGSASIAGFNYISAPVINSFTPTSAGAGQQVTIKGNSLSGATFVRLGGVSAASFTVINNTTINAVVASTTPVNNDITVQTIAGIATRGGYTFIPPPTITGFTPANAIAGSVVTINGTNFNGTTNVSFGGINAASFTLISPTQISAVVGNGQGGSITVTAAGGVGSKSGFQYTGISVFTPASAPTGATVTINGNNLSGATAVSFGGIPASSFSIVNPSSITAVLGNGSSGNIVVSTPLGNVFISGFVFISKPTISGFTPSGATSGDIITIKGTHFSGAMAVSFGGIPATSFSVVNSTTITAIVGSGASGSVSVTTPGGTITKSGFSYVLPPAISSFLPVAGKSGDTVLISGTRFTGATAVSFGNTPASWFAVQNANVIKAVVAFGTSGNVNITTPGGVASAAGFVYTGTTITSFSPASGATGTVVTITGTNFEDVAYVKFGTVNATTFTLINPTTITSVVGEGASGSVSVTSSIGIGSKTGFSFISAPVISSVSPAIIGQWEEVLITGSNFTNVNTVSLGGTMAASFTVVSPTQIKAIAGIGSSGVVSVTSPGGTAIRDGVIYTRKLCPGSNTIFTSEITGSNYRWQVNTGSGFTNISNNTTYSGAASRNLQLTNAPSSFYGYQYRCNVNGKYSKTILIRFANTWTGAINTLWNNTGNWGCSTLPDGSSDVIILNGSVTLNVDTTVRSLLIKPAANFTVQPGKKLKIAGKQKMIEKVALAPTEVLLFANTSGLIMLPGEQAYLTIRQLTANTADSIPTGLSFTTSNANIASFGSDGKVIAKQTGICTVTATNAQGKKINIQVAVVASGSPLLNEPVFVGFDAPLLYINTANLDKVNAIALNRLGQKLPDPVKIVFRDNQLQQAYNANAILVIEDGFYILTATAGEKMLLGGGAAVVYKNFNSTVLGEWSPAVIASSIINPPQGIYSVVLEWGKYPLYFTQAGSTSESVNGLVYRMVPYEIMAAGVPTGTYGITISTSEENVNVETENNTVLRAEGTTLISVKEGLGRWRVVHDNYIGPWYSSQVFADFSGDWYSANDNTGKNIKLRIPPVDPQVIYGGTIGNSLNIYQQYKQNSQSIAWAQTKLGTGQRKDNTTGVVSSPVSNEGTCDFKVEIGPMPDCLICNTATLPQRPGWGFGFLTLQNQNRFGSMIYSSPTRFYFSETGNNGKDILFVKQPISFSPSLSSFSPASSAPGGVITLKVCNASLVTSVSFGGVAAAGFIVVNNSTITAIVGQGNSGDVKISGSGGESSLAGFTIILPAPTITAFSPTSAAPGTMVTITGNNFSGTTAVGFGGIAAYSYTIVNNNTITAVVPSGGLSGNVSVKTPGGEAIKNGFTALPPLRGTTVINGVSFSRSYVYNFAGDWGFRADTSSQTGQPYYYSDVHFGTSIGSILKLKPVPGTYSLSINNAESLVLFYLVQGADRVMKSYTSNSEGTITISRVDTRCVGTINNVKVYIGFGVNGESITLNGSFDVPIE